MGVYTMLRCDREVMYGMCAQSVTLNYEPEEPVAGRAQSVGWVVSPTGRVLCPDHKGWSDE